MVNLICGSSKFWGGVCARRRTAAAVLAAVVWLSGAGQTLADDAAVLAATATPEGPGSYRFSATVRHGDTGWEHYADKFQIETPDGQVLGTRVLLHPHENEQPFTRSLSGVKIPPGVTEVVVRAHDKVHGWGKKTFTLRLPK